MLLHHSYEYLHAGDIVRAGNWGRVLQGYGGQHNLFYRETLWEVVRSQEFASLPSRLASAFYYEDVTAARQGMTEGDPNRAPNLYEIEVIDSSAPTHRAALEFWERRWRYVHRPDEAMDVARSYWRGDQADGRFEWLTTSDIRVRSIIQRSQPR